MTLKAFALALILALAVPPPAAADCTLEPSAAGRSVCVIAQTGPSGIGLDEAQCGHPAQGWTFSIGEGSIRLCTLLDASGSPQAPPTPESPGYEWHDWDDQRYALDSRCNQQPWGDPHVTVRFDFIQRGAGVQSCISVTLQEGHMPGLIDLTPCPQGTDPRVSLISYWLGICVQFEYHLPDIEPQVSVPPPGSLLPDIDLSPCSFGTDPEVTWLGMTVVVCAGAQSQGGPIFGAVNCGGLGNSLYVAGQRAGACVR